MSKRLQTLREIYGKHKILKAFEKKQFRLVELVIPTDIYAKMSYIYVLCNSSNLGVTFITDFIFNFGIEILTELIEKYSIRNIFHLMKIKELVKATLESYFKKALDRRPLLDLSDYRRVEIEFERRKYTLEQRLEFLEFVNRYDRVFLQKEKLLLDSNDLEIMFNQYDNMERETMKL